MNQFDAERYANKSHEESCSVISITSHREDEANVFESETNGIKEILRLQFKYTGAEK